MEERMQENPTIHPNIVFSVKSSIIASCLQRKLSVYETQSHIYGNTSPIMLSAFPK